MTREQKIRKARELRAKGWTSPQIAMRVDAPESTVRNWYLGGDCEKCGRPVDGSAAKKSRLCLDCLGSRRSGHSNAQIAAEIGSTRASVGFMIYRARQRGYDMPYRSEVAA